jgi:hypothetical protein
MSYHQSYNWFSLYNSAIFIADCSVLTYPPAIKCANGFSFGLLLPWETVASSDPDVASIFLDWTVTLSEVVVGKCACAEPLWDGAENTIKSDLGQGTTRDSLRKDRGN